MLGGLFSGAQAKSIQKQTVKAEVAETHAGDREKKAAEGKAKLETELKDAMAKEANMTSTANQAATEVRAKRSIDCGEVVRGRLRSLQRHWQRIVLKQLV